MTEQKENLTLADAILMGSSVIKPVAGVQMTAEMDSGCALGMANKAKGVEYVVMTEAQAQHSRMQRAITGERERSNGTAAIWGNWVKAIVPMPCECGGWMGEIQNVITHLFDSHVMAIDTSMRAKWTIEQLADWVRSVEGPAREEEKRLNEQEDRERAERWEREGAYPIHFSPQMSRMMGITHPYSGAMRPGNSIDTHWNGELTRNIFHPDGGVTLEPISNENPYMKDPFAGMASNATAYSQQQMEEMKKLTLDDLEKLVGKMAEMMAEAK